MIILALAAAASAITLPPPNPFLSQGAPAVTHNDSGASDAMPVEGPREQGPVAPERVKRIPTGLLTINYAGLLRYPGGVQATWNTNNNRVTKIRIDNGHWEELASLPIEGMTLLSAETVNAHLAAFDRAASEAELRGYLARALPFYADLLYNDSSRASLMMVFVDAARFNSERRGDVVDRIEAHARRFESEQGLPVHLSGLPYIRVRSTGMVKAEMPVFMALSMFLCAVLLLLFFRSWRVMWICMGVVAVSVVWSFGAMGLLGYKVTILMSVIAPLVIVTGVPNCVFLINAYHYEYVRHGNKMKALQRVISRIGAAAFLTNATTAVGFTTFCFTYSDTLKEFGWIATIGIMVLWALSMLLIPVLFSYMPPPKPRHLKHLERRWLDSAVEWIVRTVRDRLHSA